MYTLRYTQTGLIFMDCKDNCDAVVDAMLATGYSEEFCIALDWDPLFIARLMSAGFLVMSQTIAIREDDKEKNGNSSGNPCFCDLVLPKLHLTRSALFFNNLHVKHSIKKHLDRYELRFDTDFETVVNKCLQIHGELWLTPSLIKSIFDIREKAQSMFSDGNKKTNAPDAPVFSGFPRPVSFGLYRNGELKAGEFGIISGKVYTSYSGFREENNAGTVQMILMARALEDAGFDFLDFGMPLDYKRDLGAIDISPEEFTRIFRKARISA